jgi:hypothetical protein
VHKARGGRGRAAQTQKLVSSQQTKAVRGPKTDDEDASSKKAAAPRRSKKVCV